MDLAADVPRRKPRSARDFYTTKVRLAVVLIMCFAVAPGAMMLTVGILVLVFGHQAHDIVFGTLILSLALTLIVGITFTFLYVRRATSIAKLQTEFVQKVSHDLRTPLTSIRMFVDTLKDGRVKDPDKIAECLTLLAQESARLSTMVERLLKWASMEAGKRVYSPIHARPEQIIDAALAAIDPQVVLARRDGRVEIEREIAEHLPFVDVDVAAFTEALVNVLQNAIRYTGRDKEIRVRCVRREKEVEIIVSDNGPGIPKHEQRFIFDKFYRVVDPANPNVEGSGLGLAMVHHIVSAHSGRVTVDSDVGKGASFHIFLPAVIERGKN
jgi:two-component system, OmpR family, phosphate regulon sensor histidine kinase PhoR